MTPNEADDLIYDKIQSMQNGKIGLTMDNFFDLIEEFKKLAGLKKIDSLSSEYKCINLVNSLCESMVKCCNKQCDVRRTKLFNCSQCEKSYYCSTECQKQHWKEHKLVCKEISGERNGEMPKTEYFKEKNKLFDRHLHIIAVPDYNYSKENLAVFNHSPKQKAMFRKLYPNYREQTQYTSKGFLKESEFHALTKCLQCDNKNPKHLFQCGQTMPGKRDNGLAMHCNTPFNGVVCENCCIWCKICKKAMCVSCDHHTMKGHCKTCSDILEPDPSEDGCNVC